MKQFCKLFHKKHHYYTRRGTLICADCPSEMRELKGELEKLEKKMLDMVIDDTRLQSPRPLKIAKKDYCDKCGADLPKTKLRKTKRKRIIK